MMRHNNRRFDRDSYTRNDKRAKDALIEYLVGNGYVIHQAVEDYGFDIKTVKDETVHLFEVEIKNQWGDNWNTSWEEIRIPERKRRLIDRWKKITTDDILGLIETTFTFVVLNRSCKQGWFIGADTVDNSPVGTIQNSRWTNAPHLREPFFHIPLANAERRELETNE